MKRGSVLAVHVCLIYICLLTTTAAETAETSSNESSFASIVIGGGISWHLDDRIDFKVADNTLLIENDSLRRPILLTGGLFYVKPFLDKCKIGCLADDVLLSVAFTDAVSQNSIDEFLVGLSKRISNKLNFVVGYSLVRGKELSPGFQASAKRFIKNDKSNPDYKTFNKFDPADDGTRKFLDGLSLVEATKDQKKFFPGDPVISGTNHGIYIGLVTSIGLKEMITPGGNQ